MTEMPVLSLDSVNAERVSGSGGRWLAINAQNTDVYPLLDKVDHVICDPPYGEFTHTGGFRTRATDGTVVNEPIPFARLANADRDSLSAFVATKTNGWALAFSDVMQVSSWNESLREAGAKEKVPAIWIKIDAQPQFNGQRPSTGFEMLILAWCGKGHSRWNGGGKVGVYTFSKRHTGSHPTEKPLALMRALIIDFTNPGDIVFDPFMGSGSTGVACLELGRRFIGVERDPTYYATACKRLAAAAQVVPLFPTTGKPKSVTLFEGEKTYATRTSGKKKG